MSEVRVEQQIDIAVRSRGDFLRNIVGGGLATLMLTSCGKPGELLLPGDSLAPTDSSTVPPSTTSSTNAPTSTLPIEQGGINGPATVGDGKVSRGSQIQIADTLPPPPRPNSWDSGDFIKNVDLPPEIPGFAFTLDDGPSPYNTDTILRALDQYGIKATFFLVGVNVRAWPEIARRIRDAGHEIGNHSVYHTPYVASSLASQIAPNQQIIFEETGVIPVANRAPGLTRGQVILDTLAALGMYELHTTLNQNDWQSPRWSASSIIAEAQRQYKKGAFSLNHDGGGLRPTSYAWKGLMDVALSKGLVCLKATEMINLGTPLPGHSSHSSSTTQRLDVPQTEASEYTNLCNYDPTAELKARLDDPTLKRAERSRIVEVLLDIETHEIVKQE